MIAMLRGVVESVGLDQAIIEVGGVGYLVFCSSRTLSALPSAGEKTRVLVETHVREDHIHLYGFADRTEREWFRLLTIVQGVGAKVALAILSALPPDDLLRAIVAQDKTPLLRAAGVGPKLAGRIVAELKDKTGALAVGKPGPGMITTIGEESGAGGEEAISALVNLGFSRVEAYGAIARARQELGEAAQTDALIRSGLRELAQ
jgi:holliday junction DNA helicase RuvA